MKERNRWVFLAAATVALIVGALGVVDLRRSPYAGYFSDPQNQVVRIFPESPAEQAGLEVGDRLLAIGGVSLQNAKAMARRSRAEIGETRSIRLERSGKELEVDLTYSGLPGLSRGLAVAGALIGACFLVFPLWAYTRTPSRATCILALFGLSFGVAFLPGPYSSSYWLRTLGGAFATSAVVLGFAFLVHFLLAFPRPRPFVQTGAGLRWIYLPATAVAGFFLFLSLAQPQATSSLNQLVSAIVGIFIVSYFGWAIVVMLQNYRRAEPADRGPLGLKLLLLGTLVGLLPLLFSSAVGAVAPDVRANLPGIRFYFLTLGLIPVCFALATQRNTRTAAVS